MALVKYNPCFLISRVGPLSIDNSLQPLMIVVNEHFFLGGKAICSSWQTASGSCTFFGCHTCTAHLSSLQRVSMMLKSVDCKGNSRTEQNCCHVRKSICAPDAAINFDKFPVPVQLTKAPLKQHRSTSLSHHSKLLYSIIIEVSVDAAWHIASRLFYGGEIKIALPCSQFSFKQISSVSDKPVFEQKMLEGFPLHLLQFSWCQKSFLVYLVLAWYPQNHCFFTYFSEFE